MKDEFPIRSLLESGFKSDSAAATMLMAQRFAAELKAGDFIALHGNLGTGKTTFVKGLAKGLGVAQTVKSPSFSVYSVYDTSNPDLKLVHLDAYRLRNAADYENLLIDEMVASEKIICAEWAEIISESVPENAVHIYFSSRGDMRTIALNKS